MNIWRQQLVHDAIVDVITHRRLQGANNKSSEVADILMPVTFYFYHSTRLDNVKNFWRFVICLQGIDTPQVGKRFTFYGSLLFLRRSNNISFWATSQNWMSFLRNYNAATESQSCNRSIVQYFIWRRSVFRQIE